MRNIAPHHLALPVIAVLGLFPASVRPEEVFDANGFAQGRAHLKYGPLDSVDPLTGNLILTTTDVQLPGNAGFDLSLTRAYNSKIYVDWNAWGRARFRENSWVGLGWRLHFGRLYNPDAAIPGPIEMPDGSQHKLFNFADGSGRLITRQFWIYDKVTKTLKLPDGRVLTFSPRTTLFDTTTSYPVMLVSRIEDQFGNSLAIQYVGATSRDAVSSITQDLGNGQTRTISFTLDPTLGVLSTATYSSGSKIYTWRYEHEPSDAWGIDRSSDGRPYTLLKRVILPGGATWSYD